jgi:superfamily II DNA or RNA helicase
MDIIRRSGLLISKEYYNTEFYVRIKEELERMTKSYNTSEYVINKFYIESEKFLLIPRYFPLYQYAFDINIQDYTHPGEVIEIKTNIKPRSDTQVKAINHLLMNDAAILQLAPGVGKTVISIYMICKRKKKSFILVHRDSLVDQWKNRLTDFTNLKRSSISRLTSVKFQENLKSPIIISTVQTFLSLLKRRREGFLTALDKANIGIFIADEVHTTVGAPTFSKCSIHIPSRYTYGLSATPYRYDGNGDIIEYHLGNIFSNDDLEGTMDCKVTAFLLDYQIDTAQSALYIRWGDEFQRSRYLGQLIKSKPFMEAIKGLLVRLKNERHLICMVERTKLIDKLYSWLKHASKSKFYKTEKLDTLNEEVTFATPGKCRDGIDAPWKDCIIITSPISNIEQLTGRVIRTHPGKKTPIIIDMVDYGCKDMRETFFKRREFYAKKKWPIQYIIYVNGKLSKIDEDIAMTILRG